MNPHQEEVLISVAQSAVERLAANVYPGRGIVLGKNRQGMLVQVYWIMGRSANSRNRIFRQEGTDVATCAADPSLLTDPSLIIYHPVRVEGRVHIVSNGDQTDTILQALQGKTAAPLPSGMAFPWALETRTYEPDPPNLTPRISGIMDLDDARCAYRLSILKANRQVEGMSQRVFFNYEQTFSGFGHCITTYQGDGNPLPTFAGEPVVVPLQDDINLALDFWWNLLNPENRISLLVKFINPTNGKVDLRLVNKYSAKS